MHAFEYSWLTCSLWVAIGLHSACTRLGHALLFLASSLALPLSRFFQYCQYLVWLGTISGFSLRCALLPLVMLVIIVSCSHLVWLARFCRH
jgi:hypothetical protein